MAAPKKPDTDPQYYTGEGVNVTQRVADNKTRFFQSLILAEWWAGVRRSYKYEMFDAPAGSNRNFIGYGVPA